MDLPATLPAPTTAPAPAALPPEGALLLRPDIMQRLDLAAIFGNANPVELELGAGDGSFIAQHAALHPAAPLAHELLHAPLQCRSHIVALRNGARGARAGAAAHLRRERAQRLYARAQPVALLNGGRQRAHIGAAAAAAAAAHRRVAGNAQL